MLLFEISTMPSTPALVRNASLKYAAGFVSRAKYIRYQKLLSNFKMFMVRKFFDDVNVQKYLNAICVRNSTVLWCVDIILTWAAQYVSFFDERSGHTGTIPAHELSSHQCFYTALQSVTPFLKPFGAKYFFKFFLDRFALKF